MFFFFFFLFVSIFSISTYCFFKMVISVFIFHF